MRSRSAAGFRFIPTLTAPRAPFAGTISIHAHLYARSTFIARDFPYYAAASLVRGIFQSRETNLAVRARVWRRGFSRFFFYFSLSLSLSLSFFSLLSLRAFVWESVSSGRFAISSRKASRPVKQIQTPVGNAD